MEQAFSARQILATIGAVVAVLAAGTVGFHQTLSENWADAFYRAVITASLFGLDSRPEGRGAEVLTLFLVFAGLAIFAYIGALIVEAITRGVVTGALAERRRRRTIDQLRDHYIICGYGRVGRQVGDELGDSGVPFVVLDFNPDVLEEAREKNVLYVDGNGTEDEDLAAAGLERARGLVASSDSDSDNLYITLSARNQRPELFIVARASDADAAKKLRLAGADRVVEPYSTAGKEMAKLVLKPQVAAFLDAASATGGHDLRFEEIIVNTASGRTGQSIKQIDVRSKTGALIIAMRKRDGTFDTTPNPDAVIDDGDVIICVGTPAELLLLEELFAPQQAVAR
ncbi:MAG: potassium channel family protein [Gaiellaceae bacterium]